MGGVAWTHGLILLGTLAVLAGLLFLLVRVVKWAWSTGDRRRPGR